MHQHIRMEEALMEMKKRNDELVRSSKDAIDSPTSPKFYSTNDQVIQLKDELKRREAAHTERIVEMVRSQTEFFCLYFLEFEFLRFQLVCTNFY